MKLRQSFSLAFLFFFYVSAAIGQIDFDGGVGRFRQEKSTQFRKSSDWSLMAGALKYANVGFQYQYNYQPVPLLSLQGMAGVSFFNYNIYSSSAKHSLQSFWLPISAGARINVYRSDKLTSYVFGKYGWAFGIGGDNQSGKSKPCKEYGVGAVRSADRFRRGILKA